MSGRHHESVLAMIIAIAPWCFPARFFWINGFLLPWRINGDESSVCSPIFVQTAAKSVLPVILLLFCWCLCDRIAANCMALQ